MKLRNKKTGEIVKFEDITRVYKFIGNQNTYTSLAELNEEWEDYEEPTTYYYISDFGAIREGDIGKFVEDEIVRKEIGNYFETKEEDEKAVEKLKAWKRLKDKGFKFCGFAYTELCDYARVNIRATMINDSINDDLDLLFGGEE